MSRCLFLKYICLLSFISIALLVKQHHFHCWEWSWVERLRWAVVSVEEGKMRFEKIFYGFRSILSSFSWDRGKQQFSLSIVPPAIEKVDLCYFHKVCTSWRRPQALAAICIDFNVSQLTHHRHSVWMNCFGTFRFVFNARAREHLKFEGRNRNLRWSRQIHNVCLVTDWWLNQTKWRSYLLACPEMGLRNIDQSKIFIRNHRGLSLELYPEELATFNRWTCRKDDQRPWCLPQLTLAVLPVGKYVSKPAIPDTKIHQLFS